MSSDFFPCKWCGLWLRFDETIRYHSSGKCIPVTENGQRHDFRDCEKSDYNLRRRSKIRAKAVEKSAIWRISEYQRVEEAKEYIRGVNGKLYNYELFLLVKQVRPILGEEV